MMVYRQEMLPAERADTDTAARKQHVLLQMRNIHVEYQNVHALNGVDFDLYEGEVHALVGEHRAGKTSLVKLLSGSVQKSAGEIIYLGREVKAFTQDSALRSGIAMVYQDLSVLPNLSAIENIFAGRMMRRRLIGLDDVHMAAVGRKLFERLHLDVDLDVPLYRLTQGQQLMVEFARILFLDPRVIILDELSSKLTPREMATIYDLIMDYRRQGKGIIYITHDAEETLRLADRVTILKNGYRRGTEHVADLDGYRLFRLTYSFALHKREIEANRMEFYLLKRYSESLGRHLPVGMVVLDAKNDVQLVNVTSIDTGGEDSERTELRPGVMSLEQVLTSIGLTIASEVMEKVQAREEYTWEETKIGDGQILRVDLFPFRDDELTLIGTVILLQDVSIDRYMKDYIIRTEKMATLAQVAAGVAHEINNPLFIIRNYIELLRDRDLGTDAGEKLGKIDKELSRIDRIISSLLSFSRFKERPESRTDLVEILDDAILLLEHSLSKKHVHVERNITEQHVQIVGDENRLKQLFLNLIINGIDAVLDGGLIRVSLAVDRPNNIVEVSVADNGYGIPADVQSKIFSPFFSTKVNKKNTGLGLSICQQIAQAHGGELSFTSRPGELTEFTLRLPAPE